MDKKKYKRGYFPLLRKLMKELEDAIIERKQDEEDEVREKLLDVLDEIEESEYMED